MGRASISVAVLVTLLAAACGWDRSGALIDPDAPDAVSAPQLAVASPVCAENHDFAVDFTLLLDGCPPAEDGYDDESAVFAYKFKPAYRTGADRSVLATYEYRYLGPDQFGVRLADAVFFSDSSGAWAETGAFTLQYIRELAGSKFIGFVGGCSASFSNPNDCWFNNTGGIHLEPRFCVDNPDSGVYPTADAVCVDDNDDFPLALNQLPVAAFSLTELSRTSSSATWRFDASASSDPESQPLTYYWKFSDGVTSSSTSPLYDRTFYAEGSYTARLRVQEAGGGTDIRVRGFTVSFSQPQPLSAAIAGASTVQPNVVCTWVASVSGGTSPYSYEWRRGRQVVSTQPEYTGNTGTRGFFLQLTVRSADSQTASDNLSVKVSASAPICLE